MWSISCGGSTRVVLKNDPTCWSGRASDMTKTVAAPMPHKIARISSPYLVKARACSGVREPMLETSETTMKGSTVICSKPT